MIQFMQNITPVGILWIVWNVKRLFYSVQNTWTFLKHQRNVHCPLRRAWKGTILPPSFYNGRSTTIDFLRMIAPRFRHHFGERIQKCSHLGRLTQYQFNPCLTTVRFTSRTFGENNWPSDTDATRLLVCNISPSNFSTFSTKPIVVIVQLL